ncbi:MAG: hypothetical protein C4527_26770 [Candidatus Omnitrophota bacterium]|nr:MAG: hypothetical protein C4527_26770 [Candidatus Omnitrophota bacterium]
MSFQIIFSIEADAQLQALEKDHSQKKRFKAIKKALGFLSANPKHPSLHTHEFTSLTREAGFKIFEAYAESKTPAAYRIFWHYGPDRGCITIISITPHSD